MLEKGQISSFQLGILLYPTVLATGFLILPASSAYYARNDFWMTGLFTIVSGYLSIASAVQLHKIYPKKTIAEYMEQILGKILGKLVALFFILDMLFSTGAIARQYAEFVKGNFLFNTPILLIIGLMLLLAAFAVLGGAEMIARSAVILTPIFISPIFFLLLLIPDMHIKNIFPILGHGITPVLKGAIGPQAWVSQLFLMSFFLPCLKDPQKGKKWALLSLAAIIASMVFINLITLFLFGVDVGNKTYPMLTAFRYLSIADFFENLEALLLAMWIAGNFVKIAVFYYVSTYSIGQWMKLSDVRPIVFPVGLLILVFSLWGFPNYLTLGLQGRLVAPIDIPMYMLLLPLILLLVASFRKKMAKSTH
ncbi:GerAB/ArcD/ProY family transporter [Paenibacillus cremeus]|uniref:GerAB/ArcD/ProY family transporter n=1 Tax=Paenibacillus cremeus TaxID=2163881 RepID=A0A559KAM4_9BACL|nr:endospore germination permease [Paenibacillus cremeus]TVY09188.1 GerAB/ArcD/ProY family transporter [Paenibacillus cremeus]